MKCRESECAAQLLSSSAEKGKKEGKKVLVDAARLRRCVAHLVVVGTMLEVFSFVLETAQRQQRDDAAGIVVAVPLPRQQQHRAKIERELAENGLSHPLDLRGCACVVAGNATSFLQSIGVCSAYVRRRRRRSSLSQSTCSGRLVGYSCGAVAWMLLQVVSGVRHICAAEQSDIEIRKLQQVAFPHI